MALAGGGVPPAGAQTRGTARSGRTGRAGRRRTAAFGLEGGELRVGGWKIEFFKINQFILQF